MSNHLKNSDAANPASRNRRKKWLATGIAGLTGVVSLGVLAVATNAGAVTRLDDFGGQQSQKDGSGRGEGRDKHEGDRPGEDGLKVTSVPCDVTALFAAINQANQQLGGTLKLAPRCTYELRTGTATATGSNALPPITTDITILGEHSVLERAFDLASAPPTLFRIFQVNAGGNLRLSDTTLRNGLVTTAPGGGAVLVQAGGRAELNGVKLTQNNAAGAGVNGGALTNQGTTVLKHTIFKLNNAGASGGAVYNTGTLTVEESTIEANKAQTGTPSGGGGIASAAGSVTIRRSNFIGNQTAGSGGGLLLATGSGDVSDTTFRLNVALGNGGGIANLGATLQLRDVKFVENTAILAGGGLYTGPGATTTILPGDDKWSTELAEQHQGEAGKTETGRAEGNKAEGNKAEGNKAEGNKAEGNKAEESKAKESKAKDGKEQGGKESAAEKPSGRGGGDGGKPIGDEQPGGKQSGGGKESEDSEYEKQVEEQKGTTFFGNVAGTTGGAISNAGTLTVSDSVLLRNQAATTGGGINNTGVLVVQRSIITENQAGVTGGGINNTGTATIDFRTLVFRNNPNNCAGIAITNCQG